MSAFIHRMKNADKRRKAFALWERETTVQFLCARGFREAAALIARGQHWKVDPTQGGYCSSYGDGVPAYGVKETPYTVEDDEC